MHSIYKTYPKGLVSNSKPVKSCGVWMGIQQPVLSAQTLRRTALLAITGVATLSLLKAKGYTTRTGMSFHGKSSSNEHLVSTLLNYGVIESAEVAEVMSRIDRGRYVDDVETAYYDCPQPIGHGATISAPHMHAAALELLKSNLYPGARVLDVGSGTGYLTACFAQLVSRGNNEDGRCVGIEHISALVKSSHQNVEKDPESSKLLEKGIIKLVVGDGRLGWQEESPYDAIHVGAAAAQIPKALLDQLKIGGRLVLPVGPEGGLQVLAVIDKMPDGTVKRTDVTHVAYVPLTTPEKQERGRYSWDEAEF